MSVVEGKEFAILSIDKRLWGHHGEIQQALTQVEKKEGAKFWAALPNHEYLISISPERRRLSSSSNPSLSIKNLVSKPTSIYTKGAPHCTVLLSDPTVDIISLFPFSTADVFDVSIPHRASPNVNLVTLHFHHPSSDQRYIVEQLKKSPQVLFVECAIRYKVHTNHALHLAIKAPDISPLSPSKLFTYGDGVIITVADTGLDTSHCRFIDSSIPIPQFTISSENAKTVSDSITTRPSKHRRVAGYVRLQIQTGRGMMYSDFTDEEGGHGTHVSGSILGHNPYSNCEELGPAQTYQSKARLLFIDIERSYANDSSLLVPNSLYWLMQMSYDSGSRIFTNSWGSDINAYTFYAYQLDLFTHLHPTYTIVFSAGNSGPERGSIGTPATAKNAIAVGSTMNTYMAFIEYASKGYPIYGPAPLDIEDIRTNSHFYTEEQLSGFSSRGPTYDGRRKPDVVFPGEFILSARASKGQQKGDRLTLMRGTSMSAPLVASLLSLVDERLRKTYRVLEPTGSLRKSVLLTGTVRMNHGSSQSMYYNATRKSVLVLQKNTTQSGRDEHGFGRVSLEAFVRGDFSLKDRMEFRTFSQPTVLCIDIPRNTAEFVITLAYDDVPSIVGAGRPSMINDVSMRVVVFENGTPKLLFNGNNEPVRDTLNNVEQIRTSLQEKQTARVSIYPSGPIVSLRSDKIQVQLASLVWNQKYASGICTLECTEWDPPFECMSGGEIGQYPCVDGKYNRGLCVIGTPQIQACTNPSMYRITPSAECTPLSIEITPPRRTLTKKKPQIAKAFVIWALMFVFLFYALIGTRRMIRN